MKVVELSSFGMEGVRLAERPKPEVRPGTVLVRVRAVSLNYRDLLIALGHYNPKMPLPRVLTSDGAGEVVEAGAGVEGMKPGDRVASCFFQRWPDGELTDAMARSALGGDVDGMLQEYALLEAGGVVKVPAGLDDAEAATLPCAALTAWSALVAYGRVKAGDTVLVQGTGGVSMFALQIARMHGAQVIVTSSSDEKLARAKSMGAAHGINYRTQPDWEKRVLELTGAGVDHVVEVGGAGTLSRSFKAVRRGGRISLIGVLAGAAEVNPMPVLMRGITMQGIFVGSRKMFEDMSRAIAANGLKPVIDRAFELADARGALEHLQSGRHFGKVVVRLA